MSNRTYQQAWTDGMNDLVKQIATENAPLDSSQKLGFEHYAGLYINYVQICNRLEDCYDQMINSQKRDAIKSVIESSGGKVWFESKENTGTIFHVLLPISNRYIESI
jgi:hypothetical protein